MSTWYGTFCFIALLVIFLSPVNAFLRRKRTKNKKQYGVCSTVVLYGPDVSVCTVSGMLAGLHTITCQYTWLLLYGNYLGMRQPLMIACGTSGVSISPRNRESKLMHVWLEPSKTNQTIDWNGTTILLHHPCILFLLDFFSLQTIVFITCMPFFKYLP